MARAQSGQSLQLTGREGMEGGPGSPDDMVALQGQKHQMEKSHLGRLCPYQGKCQQTQESREDSRDLFLLTNLVDKVLHLSKNMFPRRRSAQTDPVCTLPRSDLYHSSGHSKHSFIDTEGIELGFPLLYRPRDRKE